MDGSLRHTKNVSIFCAKTHRNFAKTFSHIIFQAIPEKRGPFSRENNEFKLFSLKVGQAVSQGISTQRPWKVCAWHVLCAIYFTIIHYCRISNLNWCMSEKKYLCRIPTHKNIFNLFTKNGSYLWKTISSYKESPIFCHQAMIWHFLLGENCSTPFLLFLLIRAAYFQMSWCFCRLLLMKAEKKLKKDMSKYVIQYYCLLPDFWTMLVTYHFMESLHTRVMSSLNWQSSENPYIWCKPMVLEL